MQRCPLLETLTTRGLQDETLSDITRVLREGRCSLLKHVEISDPEYSTHKATIIEELLCSIGSMTSTTTDDTHVDRKGGLVTYIQGLGGKWSPAIIPCHAYTLTRLELSKSALFGLLTLSEIVYGLPKLLKLTIRIWLSSADEEVLATKGISKLKWICNGLTDLELAFDSYPLQDVLDPAWNGSCLDRSYTWLFSQIGELKMLRDLSLTSLFELLSLRSGPKYVEKLSELEQLRTLRLDIAAPRFIGAMEAEWMIEHWPRLIEVGITERYQNNLEEFCTILKDRRPRLRVDRKRE
ncbi:hypothetical protein BGZ49_005914 [Haplosporangium sp. Z 27]|nr:hypothetical protein BGZ49_005914 [Haplosporangium sp. Z 27]